MNESSTPSKQFSSCASLAAVGIKLRDLDLFGPIREQVKIAQKTIKDSSGDKLFDAFISLLAGAHGLVEINTRLCGPMSPCSELSGACAVQSNRWCKTR